MNETAVWPDAIASEAANNSSPAPRRALYLGLALLVGGLGVALLLYFHESGGLLAVATQPGSVLTRSNQFEIWGFITLGLTAAGGLVGLVILAAASGRAQRAWAARFQSRDVEWRKSVAALHSQFIDLRAGEEEARRLETVARTQLASVAHDKSQLESELNQLKRAEKNLSQQRQSLEVSKSVLELHVEARTKELQKLQRRYEHILNSAGEGICGLDLEGKATFANPAAAKITGWTVEELIGRAEQEIFGWNDPQGPAVSAGVKPDEPRFHRKDHSPFAVEFVKTPINESGRVVGSVLVFKDITERKRMDETLAQKAAELTRSNSELEQFAFVASHDLQEPLRKIQAFGDRLKTKCHGAIAAEAHKYLERMQNASARMRTLIDDLLAFSRVIRSSEPFVPVDLVKVAKEVLGDLEVRIEKTGASVEVGNLPKIDADPLQMRQLFLNLVGNALKFQPAGGRPAVKIYARTFNLPSGEEMCELTVEDNGIGFEEKYLEKIFAVFQRLHGRTEYEGTGVGLAVCRRITDRHHGDITARSQLGQGAKFIVTLPVRQRKPLNSK